MECGFFFFRYKGALWKIPLEEIVYIESRGKKVHLACLDNEYEYYGCMTDAFSWLDGRFFECHKWLSINLDHVSRILDQRVTFINNKDKHMGLHNICKVKKAYRRYLEKLLVSRLTDNPNCIIKNTKYITENTKYN